MVTLSGVRDIVALKLFTRVSRLGSFSAVARESRLSQSQVSRIIADLETELGARLLTRTTRAVVLTDAGAEFLARIEPLLFTLEEAQDAVRGGSELRGLLRVSMPLSIGTRVVIPRMAGFTSKHPALHVQLILEDRRQDLIRDAVDVSLRIGPLPDSSATFRTLGHIDRVTIASPAYLATAGTPQHPQELEQHRIIQGPAAAVPDAWSFTRFGETVRIDPPPHITTNENEGATIAALGGLGITTVSRWSCKGEIESGVLTELFKDWTIATIPVHAYYPMGKSTRRAARAFIDHLDAELRKDGMFADALNHAHHA